MQDVHVMSQHVEVVRGFTGRMDWPAFVESDIEETGEGDADVGYHADRIARDLIGRDLQTFALSEEAG